MSKMASYPKENTPPSSSFTMQKKNTEPPSQNTVENVMDLNEDFGHDLLVEANDKERGMTYVVAQLTGEKDEIDLSNQHHGD